MEKKMQSHLPEVNMDKVKIVLEVKEAYKAGTISLEEGRRRLREQVITLRPYEIALAEQELQTLEDDECRKENIQQMLDLFSEVMDTSRPALPDDHPIMCYYRENDAMRKHLLAVEDLVQYPIIKNQWFALYDELAKWRIHLSRKQNQLYSILERKGFDRPTTTMWLLDDFVRDEIKAARELLETDQEEAFIERQATVVADVRDLIQKEETVLYPTSLAMITPEEFEQMKSGDREIGFAFIQLAAEAKATTSTEVTPLAGESFAADLSALLSKYGYSASAGNQLLDVATGKLTLEQINLIYKHMPVDISYVDENELVCFYTDTEHRVFPRSKNVIGRDVKNCHPRSSVHLVEEIIKKFRSGEQDTVDFWINKPGLFIYIYYVAVRDEHGKFRGVLEMMQDCTRIRELQDSRTLLKWSQDTTGAVKPRSSSDPRPATASAYETSASDAQPEPSAQDTPDVTSSTIDEITPDTRLQDLLKLYPKLKGELPSIHEAFKMLSSPLARIIIPKATVRMMSERSGMPLEELLPKLKALIDRLK